MIRYELQRPMQQNVPGFVMIGNDYKTVKPSELQQHLDAGWTIIRKRYFIITPVLDWWKKLSDGNKIAVVAGIIVPLVIALIIKDSVSVNVIPPTQTNPRAVVPDSTIIDSLGTNNISNERNNQEMLSEDPDLTTANDSLSE